VVTIGGSRTFDPAWIADSPERARPFPVPACPWVPAAFIAASLWIAAYALVGLPLEPLLSAATVLGGIPV
jgi:hypothetical protein